MTIASHVFSGKLFNGSLFNSGLFLNSNTGFSVASLFSDGYTGCWLDTNDLALLYTTDGGSTNVASVSDQIGRAETKSVGVNALQATSSQRPILGQWPSAGRYYAYHDRVDDKLTLAGMPAGTYTIGFASFAGVQVYEDVYSAGTISLPAIDYSELIVINRVLTDGEKADLQGYLSDKTPPIGETDVFRGYCYSSSVSLLIVESGGSSGATWEIGDGQTATGTSCVKTITPPQSVILRATDPTKISRLDFDSSSLYGQIVPYGLTGLADLYLYANKFTGNIDVTKFPGVKNFRVYSNSFGGKLDFSNCHDITDIRVYGNYFTGDIDVSGTPSLTYAHFSNNLFSGFSGSVGANLGTLYAQNNALTAAAVNGILAAFVAAGRTSANGTCYISIGGTGNAAPTGQGITDKATLISRGWTVGTN